MTSATYTDRLLRPREVAARLQVGVRTVYALVASQRLRAVRVGIGAGTIRIHEADLHAYLSALRGLAPQPPSAPLPGDGPPLG